MMFQAIRSSRLLTKFWAVATLVTLLAVSVGLSGALPALAAPTTYYIDCALGNDGNNGTSSSTPWKTFANINSRTLAAGDSVLLKRGVTCIGGSLTPHGSGTPTSPITIGDYGTGTLPKIDCGTGNGVYSCVFVLNEAGYVIQNLEVTGTKVDTPNGPAGIYIESTVSQKSYFRINNIVAHDLWYGISISAYKHGSGGELYNQNVGNNLGTLNDVVVDGGEMYNNGGATGSGGKGIHIAGNYLRGGYDPVNLPFNTNITVRNVNIHNNPGDGVVMTSTDGGLIEYVTANTNGGQADDRYGIWPWNAKNVTIQFSEAAFNETATNKGGGGFDCDYNVVNCVFQYSYAHDNKGPGQLLIGYDAGNILDQSDVRYNLFVDNCWHPTAPDCGDVVVFGRVFNTYYHNNTIYFKNRNNNPNKIAAMFLSTWGKFGNPSNFHYKNNIVYLADNTAHNSRAYWQEVGGTYFLDYNLLDAENNQLNIMWGSTEYDTLAAFQATGQEAHSRSGNPLFTAPGGRNATDYQVANNSPAVNGGVDLGASLMGSRDYFGNAAPQSGAYDIGFHETGGAGGPTATPVPPTNTPTRTNTPVPTNTPGGPTNTPVPTNTPTQTNTPAPTATPGGSTVMHVLDIWTTDSAGAPKTVFNRGEYVYWHFKIVDQNNSPVSGATIAHHTTKADGTGYDISCVSTDATGECVQNKKIGNADPVGTWTTAVTNVTKTGATYNASANVKTSVNFTVQ